MAFIPKSVSDRLIREVGKFKKVLEGAKSTRRDMKVKLRRPTTKRRSPSRPSK